MNSLPHSANDVIAYYMVRDLPPSDYRVLFAAVLMQVKRDLLYTGNNSTLIDHRREAKRWADHKGDPTGITFRMCCEALNLDEGAAKKFLSTPYKERRPCNGRSAKRAAVTPLSARTCSKSVRRSFPSSLKEGSVSYAASQRSSSMSRMTL
jgi:hypothetical protein